MNDQPVRPWERSIKPLPRYETQKEASAEDEPGYQARAEAFLTERLGYPRPSALTGAQPGGSPSSQPRPGTLSSEGGVDEPAAGAAAAAPQLTGLARERLNQLDQLRRLRQEPKVSAGSPGTLAAFAEATGGPSLPADIPPLNNWVPIGPAATRLGQGGTQPTVSGRVAGIAVTPGARRVYVASANGGVWRSTDGGESWTSLMDAFDLNPEASQADSLSCGAIAVVPGSTAAQDRIYIGSGEGAGGAYFGVGPIVSFDGGRNWLTEPTEGGSLVGSAFYQLAVDGRDPNLLFGATQQGLYRRSLAADGDNRHGIWHNISEPQNLLGAFTSVVCHPLTGRVFAARAWDSVYEVSGAALTPLGQNFPTSDVRRIGLALHPDHPNILYALLANIAGHFGGLLRLDLAEGVWRPIAGIPATLFGFDLNRSGQGWYDLALAVSPTDANQLVLGGSAVFDGDWSASLYRCQIDPQTLRAATEYIGRSVHADVHALVFAPGDGNRLWVGCDGGVFTTDAAAGGRGEIFQARNSGLQTLTMNHIGQHPTRPEILFCGTQDNGGQRYTGDPCWLYSSGGDSGYFVINWADPNVVIDTYTYGFLRKSIYGGERYTSAGRRIDLSGGDWALFYAPLAGTPYNPSRPEQAERLAFGGTRLWLSDDFGDSWVSLPGSSPSDRFAQSDVAKSIIFASYEKIYVGTIYGCVYRFKYSPATGRWFKTDLRFHGQGMGGYRPVTDIAIDPADPSGDSIFIVVGGAGAADKVARVSHYNGRRWTGLAGRSADPSQRLLQAVHHKAIVVDPLSPDHLYVGTDVGVWRSLDRGVTWQAFSNGLPDAPVMDLKLHEPGRLLRVSTHGRGLYELHLDEAERGVELSLRQGLESYPSWPQEPDLAAESPDIKFLNFNFPFPDRADFVDFSALYSQSWLPTNNTYRVTNRVLVQVHNRGRFPADRVRVVLLLARLVGSALPPLPRGYEVAIRQGAAIDHPHWKTVGIKEVDGVAAGRPAIVSFALPADLYPAEEDYDPQRPDEHTPRFAVAAFLHHRQDPYTAPSSDTAFDPSQRKVATRRFYRYFLPSEHLSDPRIPRQEDLFDELFKAQHTVTAGQTLAGIAEIYYTAAEMAAAIYEVNRGVIGDDPDRLPAGIELRIPATLRIVLEGGWEELGLKPRYLAEHTVVSGNTLAGIAHRYYGSSVRGKWMLIYEENREVIGPNPGLIRPGMVLKIPFEPEGDY